MSFWKGTILMTPLSEAPRIGGTLVWYHSICKREVWLMAHGLEPDRDDEFLVMGRLIDQNSYGRDKKSIDFGSNRFDVLREEDGTLVIGEVKKTSRSIDAARFQLAHYLYELYKSGVDAKGQLLFPKEKKKETVELTEEMKTELDAIYDDIRNIIKLEVPPERVKCRYCRNCAYKDFCWS